MKNAIALILGLAFFSFLYIATSKKTPEYPTCYDKMYTWFSSDTNRRNSTNLQYNSTVLNDTILCLVYDTTGNINWNMVTDSICIKVKRDCSKQGFPILVANTTNRNRASWETRWGKTILLKICQ
jgi:hypothetical protein